MSLLPKFESIFSIVATLSMIQYKLENEIVTKVPEKLVIATIKPLVCYLIVKVDYVNLFLISKLMVLGIKFEVSKQICFANDSPAKPRR